MKTSKLLIAGCMGAGLSASGCAVEHEGPMPPIEDLEEGVNILAADPAVGVVGAYREGGDVVYFETRVGFTKPAIYRESFPDEPAQEIDMRFVDANGIGFYFQRGGDQFVDPAWTQSLASAFQNPAPDADRVRAFELAKAAGQAFPLAAEPALADHTFHLRAHGERLIPSEDPTMIARGEAIAQAPLPEVANAGWTGGGTPAGDSWWYLWGDMYHSSVALFGSHGAVALWAWPNGGSDWQLAVNACNHGTCAGGGWYNCSTDGGWKWAPNMNYEGSTSTGTVSGGCSSGYNWNGGSGKHNSNDDCAYEMWQVKEGTPSTSHGDNWSFGWQASNKYYACSTNGGRWTAPANCP